MTSRSILESMQALWPEFGQEIVQRGEAFRAYHIEATLTLRLDRDQTRFLEYLEVLRDGLLSDVELRGDLVDGARPVPHQPQDIAPTRLGQRLQGGLTHADSVSNAPRIDLYKSWLVVCTSLHLYSTSGRRSR
jgi:hypothetical protein